MARVSKTYQQNRFRRLLRSKTPLRITNDNTDMLVYLVYMKYLSTIMQSCDGELTEHAVEEVHDRLMRRYRG